MRELEQLAAATFDAVSHVNRMLVIAGRSRRVYSAEVDGLGDYRSVSLVADVSRLRGAEQGRMIARSRVEPFSAAVAAARAAGGNNRRE